MTLRPSSRAASSSAGVYVGTVTRTTAAGECFVEVARLAPGYEYGPAMAPAVDQPVAGDEVIVTILEEDGGDLVILARVGDPRPHTHPYAPEAHTHPYAPEAHSHPLEAHSHPLEPHTHDYATSGHTHPAPAPASAYVPIGAPIPYLGATAPANYLLVQGQTLTRTAYPEFFTALAIVGDTFTLPDYRDRAVVGASGTKALNSVGGSATATLTEANLPPHAHGINHGHGPTSTAGSHTHQLHFRDGTGIQVSGIPRANGTNDVTNAQAIAAAGDHTHTIPDHTGASGPGGGTAAPVSITPPYAAANYIVRVR